MAVEAQGLARVDLSSKPHAEGRFYHFPFFAREDVIGYQMPLSPARYILLIKRKKSSGSEPSFCKSPSHGWSL